MAPDPKRPRPLHSAIASAEKLVLGRCRLATKNVFPGATTRTWTTLVLVAKPIDKSYYPVALMVLLYNKDICYHL